MPDLKSHLKPYLALDGDMVGIKVDSLTEGQMIGAESAILMANHLRILGHRLDHALTIVKQEAGQLEFDDHLDEKDFILSSLCQRLGIDDEGE